VSAVRDRETDFLPSSPPQNVLSTPEQFRPLNLLGNQNNNKKENRTMEAKKVQLNLYVLEQHRDMLQRIAAQKMLKNPKKSVTASKIGADIIGEYLEKLWEEERKSQKRGIRNDEP
jgi:hypothetical protein